MAAPYPRYSVLEARAAIESSVSYAEAMRRMGMCASGGGTATLRQWAVRWESPLTISTPMRRSAVPARPEARKVPRPTYEQLKEDLSHMSWVAVGRKYGVSDNAVRKWMRWYRRDAEAA
jgi:transposase-like protein